MQQQFYPQQNIPPHQQQIFGQTGQYGQSYPPQVQLPQSNMQSNYYMQQPQHMPPPQMPNTMGMPQMSGPLSNQPPLFEPSFAPSGMPTNTGNMPFQQQQTIPPGYKLGKDGSLKKDKKDKKQKKQSHQIIPWIGQIPIGYKLGKKGQLKLDKHRTDVHPWTEPIPHGYKLNKKGFLKADKNL